MPTHVVTVVDANLDPARVADLISGFREMIAGPTPDGLLHSELLRGQAGAWRIQTTWRDMDALLAVRRAGGGPAAVELLDRLGAEHTHTWFVVEATFQA